MNEVEYVFSPKESTEDWIKRTGEERKAAFDTISSELSQMSNPEKLSKYLDVQSRLYNFSVSNAVLIASQFPAASSLKTAVDWSAQGQYIKKGEHAISVLDIGKPYEKPDGTQGVSYKVKKVFDVTQTVGGKIKERRPPNPKTFIKAFINTSPVPVVIDNEVDSKSGALYTPEDKQIHIKQGMQWEDIFKGLSAEIVQARADNGDFNRASNEIKAVCVTYMLCKFNNIIPPSVSEIAKKFDGMDSKDIRSILDGCRKECNEIARSLAQALNPTSKEEKSHARS